MQLCGLRPDGAGVDMDDIAVDQHFPGVGRKVLCAKLGHLLLDQRPFLRRHWDAQHKLPFSVCHFLTSIHSGVCLHDQDEDEKAKAQYLKCINIWSEMSEDGNRKLALAHQEIADIFFSENNAADALEHYVLAEKFNAEDFYVEVDVLDSVAACLLLLDKPEEGIQKFKELLEILVKYKANDTEAKFQLCNNLFCIIDAESEEEIELREMLMEQIKDEPATVEYVHNFLTNREEK